MRGAEDVTPMSSSLLYLYSSMLLRNVSLDRGYIIIIINQIISIIIIIIISIIIMIMIRISIIVVTVWGYNPLEQGIPPWLCQLYPLPPSFYSSSQSNLFYSPEFPVFLFGISCRSSSTAIPPSQHRTQIFWNTARKLIIYNGKNAISITIKEA